MSPMSPRLLRPRQSLHPEAADWAARVTAAGATYSGTTLTAVSKFCRSIDAAGIRSKFLRLNLFCGNSITAAIIPLYRSSAYGGAVVGNASDTNNNFVSADYVETGASGGLTSSAAKHLNTGISPFASGSAIASSGHFSFWAMTLPSSRLNVIGARKDSAPSAFAGGQLDNTGKCWMGWGSATSLNGVTSGAAPVFCAVSRRSDARVYLESNGVAVSDAASAAAAETTAQFGVFGMLFDTGSTALAALRMAGYSVGSALSASEGASLYSAWRTLQQSLGRL